MEKVYLIYAASLDSTPRVRFVSDTKGFTSNIKKAKLMTFDEAYFEYEKFSKLYKLFVIETTRAKFSALRWDISDNCPIDELGIMHLTYVSEEYLKPKTYDWVIGYDNIFYYAEEREKHVYYVHIFLPDIDKAYRFDDMTHAEALVELGIVQAEFPNVKLELYEYVSDPFQ